MEKIRLKEIKISIHRKYTRDFQSYGYRIGVMLDVGGVSPEQAYYGAKSFLNKKIEEEDLIIKNIMDVKDAEKKLGYEKLGRIPERKIDRTDLSGGYEELGVRENARELGGVDGGGNVLIPFDVRQIKRTSLGAVLVELFGKKGDLWIPKSCIGDGDAMDLMEKGVKTMLRVKNWFLEKNGLI